jgi:hypothetical protein
MTVGMNPSAGFVPDIRTRLGDFKRLMVARIQNPRRRENRCIKFRCAGATNRSSRLTPGRILCDCYELPFFPNIFFQASVPGFASHCLLSDNVFMPARTPDGL